MRMGEGREVLDGGLGTGQVDVGWGGTILWTLWMLAVGQACWIVG